MRIRNDKLVGNDGRNVPYVQTPNGGAGISGGKPKFLVIHYTAGGAASGAVRWLTNKDAKASAHLVVGRDGSITQLQPFDKVCWHAGRSKWKGVIGLNSHSVGIEIANWGLLKRTGGGGWVGWAGKSVPDNRVEMASHKHTPGKTDGWEIFDEAQFMATVEASQAIVAKYGISASNVVGHDDISPGRKVDPGPAFDMNRFRSLVFGRDGTSGNEIQYSVNSSSGLNLREGPGTQFKIIKNLKDGTVVDVIEQGGTWWMVAENVNGKAGNTGHVHSRWLEMI